MTNARRRATLRAVAPEDVEPAKPKVLIFGPPGVGKTWQALDFPSVFYVDTEAGADLKHYREKLRNSGGAYFGIRQGALDFETVLEQVEWLGTNDHSYKTIVFDSVSKLWNAMLGDEQDRLGDGDVFGASKKAPSRQMAKLVRWVNRLDMNVIFVAHEKALWGLNSKGQREVIGETYDGSEKLAYDLHLVLRIAKTGPTRRAYIGKSRLTGFPEGEAFAWTYTDFAKRYGRDVIEKESKKISIATPEQVAEVQHLLTVVRLAEGTVEKWFKKATVESFEEMDTDVIGACIAFLHEKLQPVQHEAA